ncbi:two-component system signal transduction response regulator [Gottschalkia acidurici 9a]|uniref:Two-component system signal transduction response regulator n=1 Tax=Gottschalkia acidurici (strain ATCC 7906 / DSM 604 / BCRC 14475 / CIP 104303 / KCTC 5404 / NCIMB 10678 / 9a) TaxID=1128398 RepID=K0B2B1_GOTA9|nr:response regulator transcription factor [Gottschalkia acidurici]AFS79065.1 two-component system signal transduction response regulator [Gottschalkia acidurici 9a]
MGNKFKVLVVDDEPKILDVVKAYLEKENFEVLTAMDGKTALNIFNKETIHIIILDLMLPELSGEEVCRNIRSSSSVPIIMLTAKVDEDERIEGISIGADDYLTKPFSVRELIVRIRALIRRTYKNTLPMADILTFDHGNLEFDVKSMVAKKHGEFISLTTNEFKVLTVLLTNPNQVLSREQLIDKAFGVDYEAFDRTVDTYIKNIRHKIEDNPKDPKYILTVYGIGYKFISSPNEVK